MERERAGSHDEQVGAESGRKRERESERERGPASWSQ